MYFIICLIFFILAIYLTIKLKFPQFKVFKKVFQKGNKKQFQTLFVSLASHIGTGNLVGVTTGIIFAGPGFLFWMFIYAFFSSVFSLIENRYAVKYQEVINDECFSGSPYYIKKGFNNTKLSCIFAFFLFILNLLIFPPFQINAIAVSSSYLFNIKPIYIGIILLLIFVFFIYNGTTNIIKITNKIVPIMSILYLAFNIIIIILNINFLPITIKTIINSALNIKTYSISSLIFVFTTGVKRSMFSNEAGLGTTPSIAGMQETNNINKQGYFQMLGVYIDTLLLCTLTGIFVVQTILHYNLDLTQFSGPDVIIYLFDFYFDFFGKILGFLFIFFFAFSSIIGEFYLGETNLLYLSHNKKTKIIYRLLFSLAIIFGVFYTTEQAMSLIDIGIIVLGSINIFIVLKLLKKENYNIE